MLLGCERMRARGDADQITMTPSFHGALDVTAKMRSLCVEVATGNAHCESLAVGMLVHAMFLCCCVIMRP